MEEKGFGKLSQLRADQEVIEDAKKMAHLLNEVCSELWNRNYIVEISSSPIRHANGNQQANIILKVKKEI